MSSQITKHEPNSARDATSREPSPHRAASATNTADMPDDVAKQSSAPSIWRSRSSNIFTVGLPYREYTNRSVVPSNEASAASAES